MMDPSSELRRLTLRAGRQANVGDETPPHLIVVSGGKTRVGTTTVAANLAASLASHGLRTVLIDADLQQAAAAAACGGKATPGIGDVIAGRNDIHEVMQLVPAGFQLVAGSKAPEAKAACNPRSLQRLMRQVQELGRFADTVVVDAGSGPSDIASRFWQAAHQVLLVTSAEAAAVMDSYATIKMLWASPSNDDRRLQLIVNRSDSEFVTADVHRRIDQSCRRFLSLSVPLAGGLPTYAAKGAAQATAVSPGEHNTPFSAALESIASTQASHASDSRPSQAA
jgi:flagellar biosynthesis protein FlhG